MNKNSIYHYIRSLLPLGTTIHTRRNDFKTILYFSFAKQKLLKMYRLSGQVFSTKLMPSTSALCPWIWSSESLAKKTFPEVEALAIYNAYDIPQFPILFPNAKRILFHDCDKKTHFYWALNTSSFPKCSQLEIGGHPCQASLVHRCLNAVRNKELQLTISSSFLNRWLQYGGKSDGLEDLIKEGRVSVKTYTQFDEMLNQFKKELQVL